MILWIFHGLNGIDRFKSDAATRMRMTRTVIIQGAGLNESDDMFGGVGWYDGTLDGVTETTVGDIDGRIVAVLDGDEDRENDGDNDGGINNGVNRDGDCDDDNDGDSDDDSDDDSDGDSDDDSDDDADGDSDDDSDGDTDGDNDDDSDGDSDDDSVGRR